MPTRTYDVTELHGMTLLTYAGDGPKLRDERDAVDVVAAAMEHGAELVVLPVERLDEDFFKLRTGVAGAMVQKFVNYQVRVTVLGDVAAYTGASTALRDFVYESNRGSQLWFVEDTTALDARLAR